MKMVLCVPKQRGAMAPVVNASLFPKSALGIGGFTWGLFHDTDLFFLQLSAGQCGQPGQIEQYPGPGPGARQVVPHRRVL